MGKRSIGQLPVFDYLVILVIGAVVGADIADPKIEHVHTIIAMVLIALLQKVIIFFKLKYRRIGNKLTFEPTIVIYNGQFLLKNMRKISYSIDNILSMLRAKDIFNVKNVELAIIEANGDISVRQYSEKESVTREDMKMARYPGNYEVPVILDGEIQYDVLQLINKDKAWLLQRLHSLHIPDETRVFYGGVNTSGELHVSLKLAPLDNPPPIFH
ncbi:DUF421 domain-containing protein [Bacillus sp. HMF5848]|nr:DUF421 domain-containing protein [Bacillus sp. HMF5848]